MWHVFVLIRKANTLGKCYFVINIEFVYIYVCAFKTERMYHNLAMFEKFFFCCNVTYISI